MAETSSRASDRDSRPSLRHGLFCCWQAGRLLHVTQTTLRQARRQSSPSRRRFCSTRLRDATPFSMK
eukprot:2482206-Pleurochrysis_carterae.AAC.1